MVRGVLRGHGQMERMHRSLITILTKDSNLKDPAGPSICSKLGCTSLQQALVKLLIILHQNDFIANSSCIWADKSNKDLKQKCHTSQEFLHRT
ncbi:hypothetical protein TNCV_1865011 [Trichonephila clavipes]|nr:hypothetical protein TNCV_1865011 [Trichonephila clavipes]